MKNDKQEINDKSANKVNGGYIKGMYSLLHCDDCGFTFDKANNGKCPRCASTKIKKLPIMPIHAPADSDATF